MATIKADLHMHGLIGFQTYCLLTQRCYGRNLLKLIADSCFEKDIGICAVTSESAARDENNRIPRNTIHARLSYLADEDLGKLPKQYKTDRFGDSVIVIEKDNKVLYLVASQGVIVVDKEDKSDRHSLSAIGSDQVPNFMNYEEICNYCNDNGILHGLPVPALKEHFGAGLEKAAELKNTYDFVEIHDAQLRWTEDNWLPKLFKPFIKYNRKLNSASWDFAKAYGIPGIAVSNAHRIQDIGLGYISFDGKKLDTSHGEQEFLDSLRSVVISNNFDVHGDYISQLGFTDWALIFEGGETFESI